MYDLLAPVFSTNIFLPILVGFLTLSAFIYGVWILRIRIIKEESIPFIAPLMLMAAELFVFLYQTEGKGGYNLLSFGHTIAAIVFVLLAFLTVKFKKLHLAIAGVTTAILILPFIKNGLYQPIVILMIAALLLGAVVGEISTLFGIVPSVKKK